MEDFNVELLYKFRQLKTEKFSEQDRVMEDQENKFKKYVSVSEEVSDYLHSSIWELKTQVNDLRRELVSLRATKDDQTTEYQKQLLEEAHNVEVLKLRLKIEKERTQAHANDLVSLMQETLNSTGIPIVQTFL
ncbi:uncharacterized protein LOC126803406 [Argentina anserina]|uniref:uncharacterized protein LOC126803406 n=1 Tax=Argentina anserina TaxID=57926 RepID=UPI0021767356|nr:uncharacterized protein LOC126803406 [Potentilla anserina]